MTAHSFLSTLGQAWRNPEKPKGVEISPLEAQPLVATTSECQFSLEIPKLGKQQNHVPIFFVQEKNYVICGSVLYKKTVGDLCFVALCTFHNLYFDRFAIYRMVQFYQLLLVGHSQIQMGEKTPSFSWLFSAIWVGMKLTSMAYWKIADRKTCNKGWMLLSLNYWFWRFSLWKFHVFGMKFMFCCKES